MRLIESKVEYIPQDEGLEGIYRQIELAGRTAYHSQDKITSDSAKDFTERMIKSKHGAALEHGTVYLMVHTIDPKDWDKTVGNQKLGTIDDFRDDLRTNPTYDKDGNEFWWAKIASHIAHRMAVKYADNPYSKVKVVLTRHKLHIDKGLLITPTEGIPNTAKAPNDIISTFNTILITTNLRVIVENGWLNDLQYICSPTAFHEKRYTMRFTCSRAIAQELTRHRVFSFLMESQRYINYSKERHGGEITYIIPSWAKSYDNVSAFEAFQVACQDAEYDYLKLLNLGMQPQQARDVLPNATKTELIMTGFASDWKRLLDLRLFESTGKVHPDMKLLMEKLWTEAVNNDIWNGFNYCANKTE